MRLKCLAAMLVLSLLGVVSAQAATLRVVVVEASDADGYLAAMEQGKALLKSKGSTGVIRVWKASYAGEAEGSIVVSVEFPSLEALAKDDALLSSDAEVMAWLKSLDKYRKIVSDGIYTELGK